MGWKCRARGPWDVFVADEEQDGGGNVLKQNSFKDNVNDVSCLLA